MPKQRRDTFLSEHEMTQLRRILPTEVTAGPEMRFYRMNPAHANRASHLPAGEIGCFANKLAKLP